MLQIASICMLRQSSIIDLSSQFTLRNCIAEIDIIVLLVTAGGLQICLVSFSRRKMTAVPVMRLLLTLSLCGLNSAGIRHYSSLTVSKELWPQWVFKEAGDVPQVLQDKPLRKTLKAINTIILPKLIIQHALLYVVATRCVEYLSARMENVIFLTRASLRAYPP